MAIERFLQSPEVFIEQEKKGRIRKKDIRPLVKSLSLRDDDKLELVLRTGEEGIVNPTKVLKKIFELGDKEALLLRILKTEVVFQGALSLKG